MLIIDRYIIKQFLLATLFALIAFLLIFITIDLMENLDDFLDHNVGTHILLLYYLYFTPEMIILMLPVAMLLSSLFTTGRLSNQNELIAIRMSGVSLYRLMVPFLTIALFISLLSVYFNGWVVPQTNKEKLNIERQYLGKNLSTMTSSNLYFQDGPTRIVTIGFFDERYNTASRISVQDYSDTNIVELLRRYDAQTMIWDSTNSVWILSNGIERTFHGLQQTARPFNVLRLRSLTITPQRLATMQEKPAEMSYSDLKQFVEHQEKSGNDVSRWLVDLYSKISFPFANFIVVLFGVPFSSVKRRSGLAVEFGISVAISFIYLAFMKASQVFGYNGALNPFITAWLANGIFFIAGIAVIIRVQK